MNKQRYPVGIQTFSTIRKENYTYIDKTDLVYEMANGAAKYLFLSRPRRFGKSLLISTLEAYFQGRKELFEGLAISQLEKEWTQYPVLTFSFSRAKHVDVLRLESELDRQLYDYERIYGRNEGDTYANQRLYSLVKRACEATGKNVVVLIDEYDSPLLDVLHEETELPKLRNVMRNFYSPLKDLTPYLRFVFLTGITKFSQLSIFSELNNIDNISMLPKYAAICGITEQEMLEHLKPGIEAMAETLGIGYQATLERLKAMYDGYHFTWPSPDIYNPFSLLHALDHGRLKPYWFGTGTPTALLEMLRKFGVSPASFHISGVNDSYFDAPTESLMGMTPLLYQSGYVTIKSYDYERDEYCLDIPNGEVRRGLMESLLYDYIALNHIRRAMQVPTDMRLAMMKGDVDTALATLREFLATCQYCDNANSEGHWQAVIHMMFALTGLAEVNVEERGYKGRMDVVVKTRNDIYILELKVDQTAAAALAQINVKDYAARFALDDRPITKIGIAISTDNRNIEDWAVERTNEVRD